MVGVEWPQLVVGKIHCAGVSREERAASEALRSSDRADVLPCFVGPAGFSCWLGSFADAVAFPSCASADLASAAAYAPDAVGRLSGPRSFLLLAGMTIVPAPIFCTASFNARTPTSKLFTVCANVVCVSFEVSVNTSNCSSTCCAWSSVVPVFLISYRFDAVYAVRTDLPSAVDSTRIGATGIHDSAFKTW